MIAVMLRQTPLLFCQAPRNHRLNVLAKIMLIKHEHLYV